MGKKLKGKLAVGLPIKGYVIKIAENEVLRNDYNNNIPLFDKNGHVTLESISNNREEFIGKSVDEIEKLLEENGYLFKERKSINECKGSKVIVIEIKNMSKNRNISQVQVSPGSRRHGNVPYVKISTTDIGKIKIIDSEENEYKTFGNEKAKLIYRRKK